MFDITIKQLSSMIKVRSVEDFKETDVWCENLCKGEHFAYQVATYTNANVKAICEIESPLKEYITLYTVNNAVVDYAAPTGSDDDFLTKEDCLMPDILIPLSRQKNIINLNGINTVWVDINIPEECKTGEYKVSLVYKNCTNTFSESFMLSETMTINVKDAIMPKQETIATQWFHADCIAKVYDVEIFS